MGIFDFLRRRPKEKETAEKIRFEDLHKQIDICRADAFEEIGPKMKELRKKIVDIRKEAENNLLLLSEAKLQNPHIPERAKQVMEGNRRSYVQKAERLMDNIVLSESFDGISSFCRSFDQNLGDFERSSVKNYHILQEFFKNEVDIISADLRKMDYHVKKIEELIKDPRIERYDDIRKIIREIEKMRRYKRELMDNIRSREISIEKEKERVKKIEREIRDIEEGKEFQRFNDLVHEKNAAERKMEEVEDEIFRRFLEVKAALKKHIKLKGGDKLLKAYIDNPCKTFITDKELRIIRLIEDIKKEVAEGKIELKDKKRSKMIEGLKKLDEDPLREIRSEYDDIYCKISLLDSEIEGSEIIREVKRLKDIMEKSISIIKGDSNQLETIKKIIREIDIRDLKKKLEEETSKVIRKDITLIYSEGGDKTGDITKKTDNQKLNKAKDKKSGELGS